MAILELFFALILPRNVLYMMYKKLGILSLIRDHRKKNIEKQGRSPTRSMD